MYSGSTHIKGLKNKTQHTNIKGNPLYQATGFRTTAAILVSHLFLNMFNKLRDAILISQSCARFRTQIYPCAQTLPAALNQYAQLLHLFSLIIASDMHPKSGKQTFGSKVGISHGQTMSSESRQSWSTGKKKSSWSTFCADFHFAIRSSPCYHSSTSFCQKCRWRVTAKHECTHVCGFA